MYGNGNIYKEAGNAVAYCNLLYIHRAILLYNFDLFSSHASQATLPELKCGQCHVSCRALPNAYEVTVAKFGTKAVAGYQQRTQRMIGS